MLYEIVCFMIALCAVYGLYHFLLRYVLRGERGELPVSEGIHVMLGFSEEEVEETLEELRQERELSGKAEPVLLVDHRFRDEVIDTLDAMGAAVYLSWEEYRFEKRK